MSSINEDMLTYLEEGRAHMWTFDGGPLDGERRPMFRVEPHIKDGYLSSGSYELDHENRRLVFVSTNRTEEHLEELRGLFRNVDALARERGF